MSFENKLKVIGNDKFIFDDQDFSSHRMVMVSGEVISSSCVARQLPSSVLKCKVIFNPVPFVISKFPLSCLLSPFIRLMPNDFTACGSKPGGQPIPLSE